MLFAPLTLAINADVILFGLVLMMPMTLLPLSTLRAKVVTVVFELVRLPSSFAIRANLVFAFWKRAPLAYDIVRQKRVEAMRDSM